MASGSTEERREQEQAVLLKSPQTEREEREIEDEHDNARGWGTG